MTEPDSFKTAVNVSGSWPKPPTLWSFSALEEVKQCPRRYALKRASYPDLWDRPGYPERVSEAGIVGVVVHEGVQVVLLALNRAGCASLADAKAVQVIRQLGGYTEIATEALDAHLEQLTPNPRMSSQVDRLRQRLGHRCAEMRQAIQALVSQSPIIRTKPDVVGARSADHPVSSRLAVGTHPEATLVAQADRFTGRLDLLAVHPEHADIIDFKTGEHSQRHTRQ
ncbi:MAG: PD-(D/E)XK nuclease family protein, partial [Gammaproteobacteria bacterium]|nr:PD-(D/E)XK nuclease family protein [Gammaproteobacteria bacterium]